MIKIRHGVGKLGCRDRTRSVEGRVLEIAPQSRKLGEEEALRPPEGHDACSAPRGSEILDLGEAAGVDAGGSPASAGERARPASETDGRVDRAAAGANAGPCAEGDTHKVLSRFEPTAKLFARGRP